jgi:outer membrane receptor protein involved in Fe transport
MKQRYQQGLKLYGVVGALCVTMAYSMPMIAQTTNDEEEFVSLEEVTVTGRKREESLQDIPVTISVIGANVLEELNVLRQEDLAALVPGFHYNEGVGLAEDRTAALPSIRGIGSTELATNRSKVASFIDGMPILGSIGAINIGGSAQVEVYSGPQSAAFGRSTFAGAINYVTIDPGDEIEGTIGVNWSDAGTRIINGSLGGPVPFIDNLGFQINANYEDSSSPDTDLYSYTDGVEALAQTGNNISARLVFEPNDQFKAKLTFSRDAVDDGPRGDFYASSESSFDCYNSLNLIQVGVTMGSNLRVDGLNECELEVHSETVLEQLNDYSRHFDNNPDDFAAVVAGLRADGAMDGYLGLSVEEQARIIYDGYSVEHGKSGSESERNRFTAQFDYLFDNGSDAQLSLMKSEESIFRGYSRVAEQEVQNLSWQPAMAAGMGMAATPAYYTDYSLIPLAPGAMGMAMQNGRRVPDNGPTDIEETYAEFRWASPSEKKLRYVVGASYYDYEYIYTDYGAPGYNNIAAGTADLFAQLIDPDELTSSGGVVAPTTIASEVTTNTAIFFNASYDITDTIIGSVEGRYAVDDVGAVLPLSDLERSVKTKSFTPRVALNWTPNEDITYYAQYSVGVNPAGINANMLDPLLLTTLNAGVAVDDTIYGGSINGLVQTVNYDADRYTDFDEERLTNFELGFKGEALNGKLSFAGAVYYMEWEDALENIALDWDYQYAVNDNGNCALQGTCLVGTLVTDDDPSGPAGVYYVDTTDDTSVNQIFVNTGVSDTIGLELQGNYQINDSWSITANGSIMKREFTNYCSEDDFINVPGEIGEYAGLTESISEGGNPCWILDGLEVEDQPSVSFTLIPRYRTEFGNGWRFNASATIRHTSQYYSEFSNTTKEPVIDRVNLNLGLAKDGWSGTLYINNLLDDKHLTPRGATNLGRFDQLNAPASSPAEFLYDFHGQDHASWRMNPAVGRIIGLRANYNF